ncbi:MULTISPECIES: glycosyltransferase family 2 protein [unclassified Mesorhizobium]|uniref:glycosyltransferase family 2 protein n=1 Tax=unclassified Mesorhizobium TaxID=325217 RepID=UPI0019D440B2|nr:MULTISPECIES: glycosyltransferase family 2 protein [unclassified Mesorhizobium]
MDENDLRALVAAAHRARRPRRVTTDPGRRPKPMPTISICIPTYNRSSMLAELLDSIIAQALEDEIEVVVSDDASPDNTVAVAEGYKGRIKHYTLLSQPKNLGVDGNFLAVVEAAKGDYIWLMGDDDHLEPGGLARVLEAIRRWPGVTGLTLGVIDYDVTMTRRTGIRRIPPTQLIADAGTLFATMGDLLGFMSALVIDRAKWNEIASEPNVSEFKNYYVQVYIIGRVVERFGKWGVVQEPCVGYRSGNDQFNIKFGWLDRLKIDVAAYDQIAFALFADTPAVCEAFRRRIFDTHVMARLNNAKTAAGRTIAVSAAIRYLYGRYHGMPHYWTRAVPTLLAPQWILRNARSAYKRLSPNSGAFRAREMSN